MEFDLSSPIISLRVKLSDRNLVTGPPGSGKSVFLKYLYLALSLLNGGCLRGHFLSIASSELGKRIEFSSCSRNGAVECELEVALEDVRSSLKLAEFQVFASLSLPYAEMRVDGKNPFDLDVSRLCGLRISSGGSLLETRCSGNALKGLWRADPREEAALPQDLLLEALFEGRGDVAFLPRGRWALAEATLRDAPLHYKCFSSMFKSGKPLSSIQMETEIFERVRTHHRHLLIEEVPGDRYYLELLKRALRGPLRVMKTIALEARDERVRESLEGFEVIELG